MYCKFLVCACGNEPFLLLFVISNYSLRWHFVPIKSRIWERNTIKSGEKDKRVNLWIRFVRTVLISWRETPRVRPRYPPTWFLLQSKILKEIDFSQYSSCQALTNLEIQSFLRGGYYSQKQGTGAGVTICTKVCPLLLLCLVFVNVSD